jgi:hypothetical protein
MVSNQHDTLYNNQLQYVDRNRLPRLRERIKMGNALPEEKESNLENYSTFLAPYEERDSVEKWKQLGEKGGVFCQITKGC